MEIRPYREGDEEGIRELFHKVFNKEMSQELWRWKYKAHGLGTMVFVAEDKGKIIAHYGGVPRRCLYFGREVISAVISDSMVDPSYRGFFKKEGVFAKLVKEYITHYAPLEGKRIIHFGYGFPMERARLLALRLGIYEDVEPVKELVVKGGNRKFYERLEEVKDISLANFLWHQMKNRELIINFRDGKTLEWRLSMPDAHFSLFMYGSLFTPKALLLLRKDTDPPRLYDYVGKLKYLSRALSCLAKHTGPFSVRLPSWTAPLVKGLDVEEIPSETYLVANALTGPRAWEVRGKFFYMHADEDT
ncbi:GNAT family N-acetyltransferase [Hydrogenobacter hydrogenophilus]|uniref:Acetyltransferase (GNAT) domain-containing protein n=1 Tax=Hydrogenobacter hydrogenophilus TaxID=35835 RepID=A0A285P5G3_9AQUI|nr:GNAT family N-acetyltransferase [Hydrogenobacter hydrogenophilus]SNZ16413.1 Acetyltransferase (GNAT) domain-containing protein [Hydrogenobacter hydrogenophilus]